MTNILTKPQLRISPEEDTASVSSPHVELLSAEMTAEEEQATDEILEHLIQTGARPSVIITGDIVDIVTAITNSLRQHTPDHLSSSFKIMTDYIARWLCDYIDQTNIGTMRVQFGFDNLDDTEGQS